MRIRRLIAILLAAALLGTSLPNPPEARANDTAWIVLGSIAGYFGAVLLATWYIRTHDTSFEESSVSALLPGRPLPLARRGGEPPPLRVGTDCAALRQGLSVVCW